MPLLYITIYLQVTVVQKRSGQYRVAYVSVPSQLAMLKGLSFQVNLAVYQIWRTLAA